MPSDNVMFEKKKRSKSLDHEISLKVFFHVKYQKAWHVATHVEKKITCAVLELYYSMNIFVNTNKYDLPSLKPGRDNRRYTPFA